MAVVCAAGKEAADVHGRADFIAKLQIALKECAERQYWSGLVKRRDIDLLQYI